MEVLMSLNTLANRCGHFFNCSMMQGYEDKPVVNNGYNCDHPECGDIEEGIGKCLASACPVAFPADGLDCEMAGMTHEECECCGREDCECEEDYMVCEIPESEFDERRMYRLKKREFTINIRETLEMQVTVNAESLADAIRKVKQSYEDEVYVLGADNFIDVDFTEA